MASSLITENDGSAISETLAGEIQRRIMLGEIPLGSWLRHETLAKEFDVSRTPVREALRILQARGVVEIVRNRGARPRVPSPRDIRDLGDVRAELEGYAAGLAADRISDEQLTALRGLWREYRDAIAKFLKKPSRARSREAGDRWVLANEEFHLLIQEAAGNPQLRLSIDDIYRRLPRNITFPAFSDNSRLLLRNVAQHEAIAEGIADHEVEAASVAMREHIRDSTELMARWLEAQTA